MDDRILAAVDRAESLALALEARLAGGRRAETPDAGPRPPGPAPRPGRVLGSIGYYLRFASDPIRFVGERFERYGDVYDAPGPDGHLFGVRHPDHLHEVLVTRAAHFDKMHSAFRQLAELLGEGLLTSAGEHWRRHRRMIQPAFGQARLAGYARAMSKEAALAAARLADGETVDVARLMMELTLRVVSRALFSHDAGGATTETVSRAMAAFQARATSVEFALPWVPTPRRARARRAFEELDRMVYRLIASRRGAAAPDPPDLLHMLVTAIDPEGDGTGLSEKEVRDELVTLFLAGHETTSNALTWTFYLLSQNPRAWEKLAAEVDAALGGRAPEHADLERLPYTEQVVKEAMRLRPPVFMVARRAREDTSIGGYPVRHGTEVVLWFYHTHHDARWYPDPEAFVPERFAPDEEAKLPKLAYVPFGAGPRACIGKTFAMIEARLILAAFVQKVRFELPPGARVEAAPRITLGPKNGLAMRVARRA
ncbi:MAG TPA: cytochrome P450 [Minicystis sp.]|nr:cytochrome P450 [Minicystis sp.]